VAGRAAGEEDCSPGRCKELSVERISRSKKETGYLDKNGISTRDEAKGEGGSVTPECSTKYIEYLDYLATEE